MDISKKSFFLAIYDADVGDIIWIEEINTFHKTKLEVLNILSSVTSDGLEDENELNEYKKFNFKEEYEKFKNKNFEKEWWSLWLPGKHRLITVRMKD